MKNQKTVGESGKVKVDTFGREFHSFKTETIRSENLDVKLTKTETSKRLHSSSSKSYQLLIRQPSYQYVLTIDNRTWLLWTRFPVLHLYHSTKPFNDLHYFWGSLSYLSPCCPHEGISVDIILWVSNVTIMLGIFILVVSSVLTVVHFFLICQELTKSPLLMRGDMRTKMEYRRVMTLEEETMEIPTPFYKEIGWCVMSDGWQNTILNAMTEADGHVNVHHVFDASVQHKNMSFIADFFMKEIKAMGQDHVFSFTMSETPSYLEQSCLPSGLRRNRCHWSVKVRGHFIWNQRLQSDMGRCLLVPRSIYGNMMVHTEMETCRQRQKSDTQQNFNKVRNFILTQADFWRYLDLWCQIIESVLVWKVTHLISYATRVWVLTNCIVRPSMVWTNKYVRRCMSCSWRWNTFHVLVYSDYFLMDKTFCRMDHDSEEKLELIQVLEDFWPVETVDGTTVGRQCYHHPDLEN